MNPILHYICSSDFLFLGQMITTSFIWSKTTNSSLWLRSCMPGCLLRNISLYKFLHISYLLLPINIQSFIHFKSANGSSFPIWKCFRFLRTLQYTYIFYKNVFAISWKKKLLEHYNNTCMCCIVECQNLWVLSQQNVFHINVMCKWHSHLKDQCYISLLLFYLNNSFMLFYTTCMLDKTKSYACQIVILSWVDNI